MFYIDEAVYCPSPEVAFPINGDKYRSKFHLKVYVLETNKCVLCFLPGIMKAINTQPQMAVFIPLDEHFWISAESSKDDKKQ